MIPEKLSFSRGQLVKIGRAGKKGAPVNVRLSKKQLNAPGDVPILLTPFQIGKINTAKTKGRGVMLNISETQMRENKKEGGILPAILIPILASIATSALTAGTSFGVQKALELATEIDDDPARRTQILEAALAQKERAEAEVGLGLRPLGTGHRLAQFGSKGGALFPLGVSKPPPKR